MKKTLLVLASALFGMSVGLSVYAADQAPAAAAPAAQAKTLGQIHGKAKTAMSPSISACSATVTMTNWLNRQPIWFPIPIILTWVR